MTSQVLFKIDTKVKAKAMKRAEREGLAFATVLKFATSAYAEGALHVGIIEQPLIPNARTRKLLQRSERDFRAGKNVSPRFTNVKDAVAWLNR